MVRIRLNSRHADRAALLAPTIAEFRRQGRTSLSAIAAGLNDEAITAPRGGQWRPEQVRQLLKVTPIAAGKA
jgi:hypothetical protein